MKILEFIENKIIVPLAVSLFILSCLWMIVESLSRQFFNLSFNFSEELIIFSLIWAIFLTFGKGGKNKVHIVVDLFSSKFSPKMLKITSIFNAIVGLAYSIFLVIVGISYINHLLNTGITSHSSLRLPMGIVFLVVPIGMLFLGLFYFKELKDSFRSNVEVESNALEKREKPSSLDSQIEEKNELKKVEI